MRELESREIIRGLSKLSSSFSAGRRDSFSDSGYQQQFTSMPEDECHLGQTVRLTRPEWDNTGRTCFIEAEGGPTAPAALGVHLALRRQVLSALRAVNYSRRRDTSARRGRAAPSRAAGARATPWVAGEPPK